ncbi:MAG: hypothetical protein KIT87_29145 [Anaerolineae bacterium]|nr:hypothetical protein [Anaerolineae bacterium]
MKKALLILVGLVVVVAALAAVLIVPRLMATPEGVERVTTLKVTSAARGVDAVTFALAPGATFEGQVVFGNQTGLDMEFTLVCLVDYIQTPCVKGQSQTAIPYKLTNGTQQEFELTIPGLAEGLHDLIVVVFNVPNLHAVDSQFRGDSRFLFSFNRTNIIVGQHATPPTIRAQVNGTANEKAAQGLSGLSLTATHDEGADGAPWRQAQPEPGESVPFHLWWNNGQDTAATVAMVTLLDWQQTPMVNGAPVLYAALDPFTQVEVAGAVQAPPTPGQHEMVTLVFENPFTELSKLPSQDKPTPTFVYSTERVLFDVK